MNTRTIRNTVTALIASTLAAGAFAMHQPAHERAAINYGASAPHMAAIRTINLDANTKYVNVTDGEVVTFVRDGKSFTWRFSSLTNIPFELDVITPKDFGTSKTLVYVGTNVQSGGA